MKTTIDLPDDILHRAKIVAVQRKTTLKELVIQGLEHATGHPAEDADKVRKERVAGLIAAIQVSNTEPMKPLLRSEIYDLYSEDLNHGQNYDGVRVLNPFLPPSSHAHPVPH